MDMQDHVMKVPAERKPAKGKPEGKQPRKKRASGLQALSKLYDKGAAQLRKAAGEAYASGNEDRAKQLREWADESAIIAKHVSE